MTRTRLLPLCYALLPALVLSACGGNNNNNLTVQDEPAMRLDSPASGELELELPRKEREPLELAPIRVTSSGEVPLQITQVEWVGEKPARVFMAKSRQEDVSSKEECSSEIYYPASSVCVLTGAPDFSAPIPAGTSFEVQLHVSAFDTGEANAITCPAEIPESVPEAFRERYCGAIRVKSDARNDASAVVGGEATVYLQANRGSGSLQLNVATINFQNVVPGFEETQSVGLVNSADTPLEITSILPTDFGQFIALDLPELPLTIESLQSEAIGVTLKIPTGQDPESLKFSTQLRIESSAPDSPSFIDLNVDNSRLTPPVPQFDKTTFSFVDDATQAFTITNPGSVPLTLTGVNFEPAEAEDYYVLLDGDGEAFSPPDIIQRARTSQPGVNVADYALRYTKPQDGSAGLASAIISYNFFEGELPRRGTARLTLLGDAIDVGFGEVVPTVLSFSTRALNERQARRAAIYNFGTAAIEVHEPTRTALTGTNEEFEIVLLEGASWPVTVEPGGIAPLEVSFVATNNDADQINVVLPLGEEVEEGEERDTLEMTFSSADVAIAQQTVTFLSSFGGLSSVDASDETTHTFAMSASTGELVSVTFGAEVDSSLANNAEWVLLSRPASSTAYVKTLGPTMGVILDVAGTYTFMVTSSSGGVDVQRLVTITAL